MPAPLGVVVDLLEDGDRLREWDEAMEIATGWLGRIRETDPKKLAFFTGRDQSQSLTGWWASQFGTPNHAAHGGFFAFVIWTRTAPRLLMTALKRQRLMDKFN
mgnify:CR=1 FL=1